MSRRSYSHGLRQVDAGLIAARRVIVWTCRSCEVLYRSQPSQCSECGNLSFIRWDSRAEQKRWAELKLLNTVGKIAALRRQIRFPLMAHSVDGNSVKIGDYVADFVFEREGERIIEDVKGSAITALAAWKLRHMAAQGTPVVVIKR